MEIIIATKIIVNFDYSPISKFTNNKMISVKHQFQFGTDKEQIDDLALKVLHGEKIATSSLYDCYLLNMKEMSRVGDFASVIDSTGKEICKVKINRIEVKEFKDITERFAQEEGDENLNNWIKIHTEYYSEQLAKIGKELTSNTKLVCEWFNVVDI